MSGAYSHLRFLAEVDWIKVRLTTAAKTNFMMVKRNLRQATRVDPLDEGAGRVATKFEATIQDPGSWKGLQSLIRGLDAVVPLIGGLGVAGIEVSFDAYSKAADRTELVDIATAFYRGHTRLVSRNRRFEGHKGVKNAEGIPTAWILGNRLAQGRTIAIGGRNDDLFQRIYVKSTDDGGKIKLPVESHRARVEIRLQGRELPLLDWHQWESFQFQSLGKWFKFRSVRPNLQPVELVAMKRMAQIGVGGHGRRSTSRMTVADSVLGRKAYDALKNLTIKMSRRS